jgi:DNA invertase Pin-like site-specific DNA recombinase
MKVGGFIFGASEEHQKQQRQRIKQTLDTKSKVTWFTEKQGHQKRDAEDRKELQRVAKFCRTNDATFTVSSLAGAFRYKWQGLTWLKHQVEMYDMRVMVADDPTISQGSLHVLSAAADVQRARIAEKSKAALEDIKKKLAEEGSHTSKRGNKIKRLGMHKKTREAGKLGNKVQAELAAERDAEVWPLIENCLTQGMGYTAIARHLNMQRIATPAIKRREARDTLGVWYASTVRNIVLRRNK